MPLISRFTAPIPNISLPTYLFTSPTAPLPTSPPVYLSAENPATEYISLSAYRLYSQRLAGGLRARGLQPGERVMLFSGNNVFFPVVIMGIIMSGGIFTGANPSYSPRELAHQLKDADCRFMLTSPAAVEVALQAATAAKMLLDNIYVFDTAGMFHKDRDIDGLTTHGLRHWTSILIDPSIASTFAWAEFKTEDQCQEIAALNYSSGTTGLSKGVTISHRNFVSNAIQLINLEEQDPAEQCKRPHIRLLACLPMYHAMGQCIFVTMAPKRRIPSYVMEKFDFLVFLECVERYRITELTLVPPIAVQLARRPETKKFDLGSVNTIASGAAPLSKEVCTQLEAFWPAGKNLTVKQGWGMTECTCGILGFHPLEKPIPGSVGELTANCEAKVMGEDYIKECARRERGEIWIRAPNVTQGYWRNEGATRGTITQDGWLKTGDVGFVDEAGKWFVVDRMKELIKAKGHQVAPAELEGLLLDHPAVQDAAVIGVVLADTEEHPRAYIVPTAAAAAAFNSPGSKSSTSSSNGSNTVMQGIDARISPLLADILEATNKKLAPYKRITGGIVSVDAIPKNPSGKLLRKQLREQALREMQVGRPRL